MIELLVAEKLELYVQKELLDIASEKLKSAEDEVVVFLAWQEKAKLLLGSTELKNVVAEGLSSRNAFLETELARVSAQRDDFMLRYTGAQKDHMTEIEKTTELAVQVKDQRAKIAKFREKLVAVARNKDQLRIIGENLPVDDVSNGVSNG